MNKKFSISGFTLIELLVLILIIGVLVAVALPQYQKAVFESRLTEIDSTLHGLVKSIQLYTLEHGIPSTAVYLTDELDIGFKWTSTDTNGNHYNKLGLWRYSVGGDSVARIDFMAEPWMPGGKVHPNPTDASAKDARIAVLLNENGSLSLCGVPKDVEARRTVCEWWVAKYGANTIIDSPNSDEETMKALTSCNQINAL